MFLRKPVPVGLVVFASLRPEQIDLGRTGSRGVRDLAERLGCVRKQSHWLPEPSPFGWPERSTAIQRTPGK